MPRLSFYPVGGDHYLLVVAVALALLGLLVLGPTKAKTGRRRKVVLVALRAAVIALVVMLMLRPTWVYTKTVKQSATLVILADQSRSLTVPDEVGGRTRYEALRRTLAGVKDELRGLAEEAEVTAYAFDAETRPVEVADGEIQLASEPLGDQTAIGAAVEDVLRDEAGKRILGVILLSDGAQRAYPPRDVLPQTVAGRLKRQGFPLYTVRFGKARGLGQAQDVAVTELLADERVFVKNQLTVTGEIRVDGYVNRRVPVRLLVETAPGKMEPVDQADVEVTADGQRIPVEFVYVPEVPGEVKLVLEVEEQSGELVTTNNRQSTFVRVLAGGINVLYLEGELRREISAIRNALGQSPDINVEYHWINHRRPDARPPGFSDRFKAGRYDVYILGDLDSSVFGKSELEELEDAVAGGAGLIMIGGFHSFGPGAYSETPLARVLPVEMDRLDRQPLDGAISEDLHLPHVKVVPTEIGLIGFVLRLAASPQESQRVWSELPPLLGANRFGGTKDGALVLATDEANHPLLVQQSYGSGRVLAFAGDSTWRWTMRGYDAVHNRFWRQIVLWLARKDESLEGNVWIRLRQRRFAPGQRVEFEVGAQSAAGEPIEGAKFQVDVVTPDDADNTVTPVDSDDRASCSFRETRQAGDYSIRVTATKAGQLLGSNQARFLIFEQDLELDNASADATLLDSLSAITGGESIAPEELSSVLEKLIQSTEELEVQTETKQSLWDTWTTFLLVVFLLSAEWYLRKKWGLV
jgi:uncharacterized membrane protein